MKLMSTRAEDCNDSLDLTLFALVAKTTGNRASVPQLSTEDMTCKCASYLLPKWLVRRSTSVTCPTCGVSVQYRLPSGTTSSSRTPSNKGRRQVALGTKAVDSSLRRAELRADCWMISDSRSSIRALVATDSWSSNPSSRIVVHTIWRRAARLSSDVTCLVRSRTLLAIAGSIP